MIIFNDFNKTHLQWIMVCVSGPFSVKADRKVIVRI